MKAVTTPPRVLRFQAGQWEALGKEVIVEAPVSLTVNGQEWVTLMCTPSDLEALAVGFLFNEGLLKCREEIDLVQVCPQGDNVDVWLNHPVEEPKQWRRTAGCTGGITAVQLVPIQSEPQNGLFLIPEAIQHLLGDLTKAQALYRQVGGVHASILSNGECVLACAEDVGRHNSLDKIAGHCLLDCIQPGRRILATTGRLSSEMIQKAARIGAAVVISRKSASSLAISLAERWGITLVGYARCDQFTVYTHPERILQTVVSF